MAKANHPIPATDQKAELFLSILIFVLFSLTFGYLLARALAHYQPAEYPPTWGNARWIGGETAATIRYFRYRFDVQGTPASAYLLLGAPDELDLYVNGRLQISNRYFGARVTEIRDLRGHLLEGVNLIAIRVAGQPWETRPLLIARLVLENAAGTRSEVVSGPAWKVRGREMQDPAAEINWTTTSFDDSSWPNAVVKPPPEDMAKLPLEMPETVFSPRQSTWHIWSADAQPQATLVRDVEIPGNTILGAWLEVGFSGFYSIAINGHRLHSQVSAPRKGQLFSVGRYLHPGANRLELSAESSEQFPRLYARLLADTDKGELWVPTDGRWMTPRAPAEGEMAYRPVQLMDLADGRSHHGQVQQVVTRELDADDAPFITDYWWYQSVYAACVLLAAALIFPLFHISVRHRTTGIRGSFGAFVQPLLFGLLLFGGIILFDADPRFADPLRTLPATMALIGCGVVVWLALIMLEASLYRKSHHD